MPCGILESMAPRHGDRLTAAHEPRWLVIRDRMNRALEYRELWPGADLSGALDVERDRRIADRWRVDDLPHHCSVCFLERGEDRLCIAVECYEPGPAPIGHV